jgi:cytochrome c oxidase subunit 3
MNGSPGIKMGIYLGMDVKHSQPTSSPQDPVSEPPVYGGGGIHIGTPERGFGGDDAGNPDAGNTAAYQDRLRRCRWGVGLSMVSVTMLFVALSVAFMLRQRTFAVDDSGNHFSGWLHLTLPPLLALNTVVLLLSSISLEFARRSLRRQLLLAPIESIPGIRRESQHSLPWLGITLILGLGFIAGQIVAWRIMLNRGFFLADNPSSSFFYLLTGVHALHLTVGIFALLYASLSHLFSRRLEMRCLIVDVTSWYWHFMAVLWLYVYALLSFAQ